ncbi:Uncharacterized protein SCF082_LOCUS30349 [Durusdinium trenchii]|uniref:Uncharacterized protein n=1 Tax=Durusdinium trenchii TaxID=1381693 RepID=A0ABP0N056_9DINO
MMRAGMTNAMMQSAKLAATSTRVVQRNSSRQMSSMPKVKGEVKKGMSGQGEGGHPHVMQDMNFAGKVADMTSRNAPLKVIMAAVVCTAAYKLMVVQPSKPEVTTNPEERRTLDYLENDKDAVPKRLRKWQTGPFNGKNKEVLGIKPSDEKLEQ